MPLQHVFQERSSGCFVAATAILTGKTYQEAFKLIHPTKEYSDWEHGVPHMWNGPPELSVGEVVKNKLLQAGVKSHVAKIHKLQSLRRHSKKHALLIIRWKIQPDRCHAVVFDAETRSFLDPGRYSQRRLEEYESQLDTVLLIDELPIPEPKKLDHDIRGDAPSHSGERREDSRGEGQLLQD